MKIPLYLNGASGDLRDVPEGTSVAIMTGAYDPLHQGHGDTAQRTLASAQELSGSKVDLVLLRPHSYSPGKSPAPLEIRIKIMQAILGPKSTIGILNYDPPKGESTSVRYFFAFLREYHQLQYSRIIGSDRLTDALQDKPSITHFVNPRDGNVPALPPDFFLLPPSPLPLTSSTQIRRGEVELGEEYDPVMNLLRQYYPHARIRRRC